MNILLTHIHSYRNAGDAALTEQAIRQIKQQFPHARVTLLMNDPQSYSGRERAIGSPATWVKFRRADGQEGWRISAPFWLILLLLAALWFRCCRRFASLPLKWLPGEKKKLLRAFLDADRVLACPGGYLLSSGRVGATFWLSMLPFILAIALNKPFALLPQSIGPLERRLERLLTGKILSHAKTVLLRESISRQHLAATHVQPGQIHLVPDLAFALPPSDSAAGWAVLQKFGITPARRPLLGITLINRPSPATIQAIAQASRDFIHQHQGTAILFAQVTGPTPEQDDRIAARQLTAALSDIRPHVVMIEQPLPPATLQAAYGCCDLFLGTRLHSLIFALTGGTPVLGLGYHFKTRGVLETVGLDDWLLDIRQADGPVLSGMLEQLWQQRDAMRQQIQAMLPEIRRQAASAMKLIVLEGDV